MWAGPARRALPDGHQREQPSQHALLEASAVPVAGADHHATGGASGDNGGEEAKVGGLQRHGDELAIRVARQLGRPLLRLRFARQRRVVHLHVVGGQHADVSGHLVAVVQLHNVACRVRRWGGCQGSSRRAGGPTDAAQRLMMQAAVEPVHGTGARLCTCPTGGTGQQVAWPRAGGRSVLPLTGHQLMSVQNNDVAVAQHFALLWHQLLEPVHHARRLGLLVVACSGARQHRGQAGEFGMGRAEQLALTSMQIAFECQGPQPGRAHQRWRR